MIRKPYIPRWGICPSAIAFIKNGYVPFTSIPRLKPVKAVEKSYLGLGEKSFNGSFFKKPKRHYNLASFSKPNSVLWTNYVNKRVISVNSYQDGQIGLSDKKSPGSNYPKKGEPGYADFMKGEIEKMKAGHTAFVPKAKDIPSWSTFGGYYDISNPNNLGKLNNQTNNNSQENPLELTNSPEQIYCNNIGESASAMLVEMPGTEKRCLSRRVFTSIETNFVHKVNVRSNVSISKDNELTNSTFTQKTIDMVWVGNQDDSNRICYRV